MEQFKCKFCGKICKKAYSLVFHQNRCKLNPNRVEHNWKGRTHSEESKRKQATSCKLGKIPNNIFEVSSRTRIKILKRLNLECSNCGWNEASCDLHHILERANGGTDDHTNLTYLCPNCHRLAHSNKLSHFITFKDQIQEKWREQYLSHG